MSGRRVVKKVMKCVAKRRGCEAKAGAVRGKARTVRGAIQMANLAKQRVAGQCKAKGDRVRGKSGLRGEKGAR